MFDHKFNRYVPFEKVEIGPNDTRIVRGIMTDETQDADGEVIEFEGSLKALDAWRGNVREMHQKSAVGKALSVTADEASRGIILESKIVDPVAVKKIDEGVYTGYSIGGTKVKRDPAAPNRIKSYNLIEVSVVDNPANPSSVLEIVRLADGNNEDVAKSEEPEEITDVTEVTTDAPESAEAVSGSPEGAEKVAVTEGEGDAIEKDTVIVQAGAPVVQESDPAEVARDVEMQYTLNDVWSMTYSILCRVNDVVARLCPDESSDGDGEMALAAKAQMTKTADGDEAVEPLEKVGEPTDLRKTIEAALAGPRGELQKAMGQIADMQVELEKLKSEPAPGGPILSTGALPVEKTLGGNGGAPEGGSEMAVLQKLAASTYDPYLRQKYGEEIALRQIQAAQKG